MNAETYLIVTVLSIAPFFNLSMSMCAPVTSRIALMLQPPRPITRDIRFEATIMRFTLKN